ncbi:transglycosylase domain-containing protein [Curtobacterium sp. ISL-83]|nr:transglycosylase domain-containing protein [Curtobacterium sp. ISL-83]
MKEAAMGHCLPVAAVGTEDPRFYWRARSTSSGPSERQLPTCPTAAAQGASTLTKQYVKNVSVEQCEQKPPNAAIKSSDHLRRRTRPYVTRCDEPMRVALT